MPFDRVFTDTPWEKQVGYCRALRAGNQIFVSGTAPVDQNGNVTAYEDGYAQAKQCLEIIRVNLLKFDAQMKDVVRTRMFVTDMSRWPDFARAHQEAFGDCPPVTSMIEVKSLISPLMLIEIEAEAVVL
jgi:enamine deaminase RidA (YjgF/YER057c/UK114 family)